MKHINSFEKFIGESAAYCDSCDNTADKCVCKTNESANPLNESDVFIANDKFKDEAALKADIAKNMAPAFNKLLKDNGITFPAITVEENRGRYEFDSKPLTGKDLGIMQWGIKELYINSFGGGSLPKISKDADGFEFSPLIWFNLHYSYTHGSADINSQGSNGCSLYLPGERTSNIWYDIVNGVFLKDSEAQKLKF